MMRRVPDGEAADGDTEPSMRRAVLELFPESFYQYGHHANWDGIGSRSPLHVGIARDMTEESSEKLMSEYGEPVSTMGPSSAEAVGDNHMRKRSRLDERHHWRMELIPS